MTEEQRTNVPRVQRYASIDIGTNSVKLWVAEPSGSEFPRTVFEELQITKLGKNLSSTGKISTDAMERTLQTTSRFVRLARGHNAQTVVIGATSAVRQASNQDEFLKKAEQLSNHPVQVISGSEEARFTFSGVTYDRENGTKTFTVFDVGGGSTEFIHGLRREPSHFRSIPIGSVQLHEDEGWSGVLTEEQFEDGIRRVEKILRNNLSDSAFTERSGANELIGVGGTVATLAQVYLNLSEFVREQIEGCCISKRDLKNTALKVVCHSPEDRVTKLHVKPGRKEYIAGGAAVVNGVLNSLEAESFYCTCRGLRHGLLIENCIQGSDN